MANPEIAVDVQHLQEEHSNQRWVVDQNGTTSSETTTTPANSAPKDTRRMRKWPTFNTIFNPKRKFLPIWNNIFVISCVFAVSCDPLFFYIPFINKEIKCLMIDTKLKTIAFVFRLLTDHFYIADIIVRILTSISQAKSCAAYGDANTQEEAPNLKAKKSVEHVLAIAKRAWAKANRSYILIDIFAILPIPQVGMFVFISKMKGHPRCLKVKKVLDSLVLLQFIPRVLPIYLLCQERSKTPNKAGMWTKGVFNFFLYILASHVLGALCYFFSIEREIDRWIYDCQEIGCQPSSFICSKRPNATHGTDPNLGIFSGSLHGKVQSSDFPLKFLNCFGWGLRQLSSLGQNLDPSTNAWENLFAVFISIIGLLVFIYLIGNLQAYVQFATARSEKLRRKMKTKNLEVELWLSRKGLPSNLKEVIMHIIQQTLEQNKDVQVENILSILPSAHSKYIKRYLRLATLKKVPMLQTVGVKLLKAISVHLEPVDYPEDSCIFREGDRINKMIFITHGTVQTYRTNGKGGKFGSKFLEKGDFYGADELLEWASKFSSFDNLPTSMRMVKPVTKVEAFELSADDLKSVAIKYWWHFTHNKKLIDFNDSLLEEFAEASIEKEIRRQKTIKQAKKKRAITSLTNLRSTPGSKKFQQLVSMAMRDQLPSPVCALDGN
ncbi:hypothetical protein M0R45_038286 [Rubus argutus]|uniref:Cyclic nucleotide-binding domain-containing protein n=1 Tax=Rubus argutus TaxID=59490 RepID=A0AAW1VQQ9_RUBAR